VDAGLPPIILTDPHKKGQSGKTMHYQVVIGYSSRADEQTTWKLADPWGGVIKEKSTAELLRNWSHLHLGPVKTPINRLIVTLAPPARKAELPPGNGSVWQKATIKADDLFTIGAQTFERIRRSLRSLPAHPLIRSTVPINWAR
jgi:hypothetical protein